MFSFLATFIYFVSITYSAADNVLPKAKTNKSNLTFKDYLQQFKPTLVWRRIEESNKLKGINNSIKDEIDNILNQIDVTEELLQLKIKKGDPKIILNKDSRRQFIPPGDIVLTKFDQYNARARLVELMKQAIYQARNKMIIMQELRERYRKMSLYKMGFLIAKTDLACKAFSLYTYKTFRFCMLQRQFGTSSFQLFDNLEAQERVLDLWFDVDLLIDLVVVNHENCKRMLNQVVTNRKHAWKFFD